MNSAEILERLARSKTELTTRYGVMRHAVLGTSVRSTVRPDCDPDEPAFVANALVYDATLRNLQLIGERDRVVADTARPSVRLMTLAFR